MEKVIEFKNFEKSHKDISADLYLNGEFIVRMSDVISHMIGSENTNIALYEYFRKAAMTYIDYNNNNQSIHDRFAENKSNSIH